MDNTSSSQTMSSSSGNNKKQRLKGRPKSKHNKPKMTKEQRREKYTNIARNRRETNMTRARDKQLICYLCRKTGHSAANCKNVSTSNGNSNNMPIQRKKNICYKCGSTEHRIQACPAIQKYLLKPGRDKKGIDYANVGELPFAMCYVCNKKGHLSSYCPEGKKGCYPTGGGCRECGSVDHYVADCPERKKKGKKQTNEDAEKDVTIDKYLDDERVVEEKAKSKKSPKKRKVVNF